MAADITLSRRLATVLLAGPWTIKGIRKSLRSMLDAETDNRILPALAKRIVKQFESNRLPPTRRQLVEFLNRDDVLWDEISLYHTLHVRPVNVISLPRPEMLPGPGAPADLHLPKLVTPGELADWVSVGPTQLDWLADTHSRERFHRNPKLQHYHYRWLPKKRMGHRLIEEPKPLLKSIQRRILHEILHQIPPHEASHAFCPGRSVLSYVAPHVEQHAVLHLDLRHFFSCICQARVRSLFRWIGYPEAVANLLTGLCTNAVPSEILENGLAPDRHARPQLFDRYANPHLPQGAPTSPALANLTLYRLDCRLSGLARKSGAQYTRYADDLLFSGDRRFRKGLSRLRVAVMAIAIHEGFEIHHQKTRVMPQGTRQEAAGLVLNRHPNTRRTEFDRLRAILFNCIRYGPDGQNRNGAVHFKAHLEGQIAYQTRINPQRGSKLRRLFEQIVW